MTKYSYELKKQVVQDYLEGLGGYKKLAKKYNLASKGIILNWLNVYEHYGFEGLEIKRKKRSYTTKFKEKAVQYYVTGQLVRLRINSEWIILLCSQHGYANILRKVQRPLKTIESLKRMTIL